MEMMANIYTAQTPQFGVSKVTFEVSFGVSNEDFYSQGCIKLLESDRCA